MKRTLTVPDLNTIPDVFHSLLNAPVYDSSCSPEARVWFLDTQEGLFLKTAPKGTLRTEAEMNRFFRQKGLGPEVLDYLSLDADWMLTRAIPGEDCTHPDYLADPIRLCRTTATLLRSLHDQSTDGCPVCDKVGTYWEKAKAGYSRGYWEPDLFAQQWNFPTIDHAWKTVEENIAYLKNDTLLHGDYCLPNIMLDRCWNFTGFIDLGNGGIGDRHMDILWGIWTLEFNLHTNRYRDLFMDVYGRDRIDPELLRTAAALEIFT